MKKIMNYEQINNLLNDFCDMGLKECEPIGYTYFNYPIRYFTYGNGKKDVIMVGGTHSDELISVNMVLEFIKYLILSKKSYENFKFHFIPIINPEGNIIVTSVIDALINKDVLEEHKNLYCEAYSHNAYLEEKYLHNDVTLNQIMFKNIDLNCISQEHKKLKESIKKIDKENKLPQGALKNWASNGRGIDLNHNVNTNNYINYVIEEKEIIKSRDGIKINISKPTIAYCPMIGKNFKYEKENEALLNFYASLNKKNIFLNLIFHSIGEVLIYKKEELLLANLYKEQTNYKLEPLDYSKPILTFNKLLATKVPNTLLVELSKMRGKPLGSFSNDYEETVQRNIKAIQSILESN